MVKRPHGTVSYSVFPQGSVLGPRFFLVYINGLAENALSPVKLFADDTSIFRIVSNVNVPGKY